jgi:hypothetical protein
MAIDIPRYLHGQKGHLTLQERSREVTDLDMIGKFGTDVFGAKSQPWYAIPSLKRAPRYIALFIRVSAVAHLYLLLIRY